jgi:hypothetical protein
VALQRHVQSGVLRSKTALSQRMPMTRLWRTQTTMPSKKLISLFLLIFVLVVLFYIMWVISREYPLELAFRDQKWRCCNYSLKQAAGSGELIWEASLRSAR